MTPIRFMSFIGLTLLLLGMGADAQTLQSSSSGGGIVVSTTTVTGGGTGCVMFKTSLGAVGCDTSVVDNGSGQLTINNLTHPTANFLIGGPNNQIQIGNTIGYAFTNSANGAGTVDVAISRSVPGVIAIGTGVAGNTAGGYITGTASLTSLTTGTNADFLCLAANGTVLLQNAACTISSLRFKPDWKPYRDDAMAKVAKFDVGTFHLQTGNNRDPNASSLQAGLSAESVAAIAPECAVYEDDMKTPKSYRQECVIALLVKAIQQLKK